MSSMTARGGPRDRLGGEPEVSAWRDPPGSGSPCVIVPAEQFVGRCRARLPLLGGRRETGSTLPMADEAPLPGSRPMPGQHVTHSRMAPPPGSCGRHLIDGGSCPAPDLIHPASRLSVDLLPPSSAGHGENTNHRRRSPTCRTTLGGTGLETSGCPFNTPPMRVLPDCASTSAPSDLHPGEADRPRILADLAECR
jgi:hypothetical protein